MCAYVHPTASTSAPANLIEAPAGKHERLSFWNGLHGEQTPALRWPSFTITSAERAQSEVKMVFCKASDFFFFKLPVLQLNEAIIS